MPTEFIINQISNQGRHGRNPMRKKQGTSVSRSFFSLLNMQSNNNEAAILPIDSFLEKSFPFTDITLHLSADAITFLMGTTKGRLNLMYYMYILHTMTIGDKSQMVRGIRVDTGTCQCSLSVSSLEEVWGIKRKQGRNLLDKMEQLGLISRSSDFVTSIVDVVSVQEGHAMGQVFTNPNRLLLAERNQTSPVLSPPAQSVQGTDAATVIMETSEKPQTAIITSSEATIPSKATKMPQSLFDFDDEDGTVVPYGRHE